MNKVKYIVFPDIHGRTFWRFAVNKYILNPEIKFIFLGDYLDPYPAENIEDPFLELIDIIKYKKEYPNRFVLLLGNHDIHYLTSQGRSSRFDWDNADKYKDIFINNIDLFSIIYTDTINNKNFCFSHAGIQESWINRFDVFDMNLDDLKSLENINAFLNDDISRQILYGALMTIPFIRGGNSSFGSPIWSDVREHLLNYIYEEEKQENVIQVFGHTQLPNDPINLGNYMYCIDCRRYFYIDDNGDIIDSKDDEIIPVYEIPDENKQIQDKNAK